MIKTLHTTSLLFLFCLLVYSPLSAQEECGCTNCPVQITDNDSFEAYIDVSIDGPNDLGDCQLEQVCFTITHTWVGDLAATLTTPSGLSYIIMGDDNNNFGGCGNSNDDIDVCIVTGTGNPLTNNTAYICNGGAGDPCLIGDWTMPCGGVTDPVTGANEAPNCDLNDFNVPGDPVNGTWTLTINDICGSDTGPLEDWSLVFSCPILDCISCEPEGGSIPPDPVVICDGNASLDLPPSGHQTDSEYGYTYIISENDVVVDINDGPDLSGLPPGIYEVCGFNYSLGSSDQLFDLIGQSLSDLQDDFASNPPFCADFSDNCVEVSFGEPPFVDIDGPTAACEGTEVEITVIDGPFGNITWSTGESSETISVGPGTYSVTVEDDGGCESEAEITIDELPAPEPQIIGPDEICEGEEALLETDIDYESYEWSTGETFASILVTEPGGYEVTVIDADGCEGYGNFVLNISDPVEVSIMGDLQICGDGGETILDAGPGFATYEWSTGETSQDIVVTFPDFISVTVTNDAGCEGTDEVEITLFDTPVAEIAGPDVVCTGATIELEVTEVFNEYEWSNGFDTRVIEVDAPGLYTVTVTDNNGCEATAEYEVIEGLAVDAEVMGDLAYCQGSSTTITITDGYESYEWSTGESGNEQTIDLPDNYMVTVTSVDGCEQILEFDIQEVSTPAVSIDGDPFICEGETSTLVAGDFATYEWSTGDTGFEIMASETATYFLTVTDDNGCEAIASFNLTVNTPAQIDIIGDAEICDDEDGQLTASAGFVTYEWSNSEDTPTIMVSEPGIYSVIGTDSNGCTSTDQYEVTEVASPQPTIDGDLTVCPGSTTVLTTQEGFTSYSWTVSGSTNEVSGVSPGDVTVVVTNAAGCTGEATVEVLEVPNPMPEITGDLILCEEETSTLSLTQTYESYQWSDATTDPTIEVEEGTYSVTVTDAEGCMGSTSTTLEEVIPMVSISGDDDFCIGETTTLSVPDDFATYAWSTGANGSSITTTPGTTEVTVTVTDENGCTATDVIALTEFPLPEVAIEGRLNFCPAGGTELSATEGFASYAWSNMETTSTIATNVEGTYSVTVTDTNGCQNTASVEIVEDSELDPEIAGVPSLCAGESTVLTVPDDYQTYTWSHGPMTSEVTLTEPGDYTVTVADEFGCMGTETVTVEQFELPTPSITGTLDYCVGDSTMLNGGSGYADYAWSGGDDTQFLTVNSPGTIGLTVTDDNGCVGSTSADVLENALPVTSILGEPGFCPGLTTLLTAEDGFVAYQWSTNTSGTSIEVGTSEIFSLTVTDANGCEGVASQLVEEYATTVPEINGAPQFCPGESTMLTAGVGFETYNWSNGSTETSVTIDQEMIISLDVTDTNGCVTSNSLDLSNYTVTAPNIDAPEGFCAGNTADLVATPGYASYNWSNSDTTPTITIGTGGIYELDVIDSNGCPSSAAVNVAENALPTPAIGGSLTFCIGNSTQLNAGGTYETYQWSTGSDEAEVTVSNPGDVGLTVTDVNGCVGSTSEFVNEATELSPVISGVPEYCAGLSTTLSAGSGFATYEWSNGGTGSEIEVNTPGIYTLNVTDTGGCAGTTEVEVVENALPQPEITGELDYCAGLSTELFATLGFVTYDWNTTELTTDITVATPGEYSVTVMDDNGCINETSTTVIEQPLPVFEIVGPTDFCVDSFTVLNVMPAFAEYAWSSGETEQEIQVNTSGTVGVTVTDANGCVSSEAQAVATVSLPLADAGGPQDLDCDILEVAIGGNGSTTGSEFTYQWTGPGITPTNENEAMPVVDVEGTYTLQILNETYGCLSVPAQVEITDLSYEPQIIIEVLDILDCATATVQIDARDSDDGAQFVYQWYDQNLNPIPESNTLLLTVNEAQFYTLEIIDTITGCNTSEMIEVTENELYPLAEAGLEQLITCGDPIVTLDGTGSQQGGAIDYEWTTPDGNIVGSNEADTAMINQSGWYYLQVTDTQNGCFNIDSVFVAQDTDVPIAQTSADFELDCNFPSTSINGTGSSVGSNFTYQWLLNNNPVPGATTLQLEVETAGTYTLLVTDLDNECTAQEQVEITLNPAAPQVLNFVTDTPTCAGDADGGIFIGGVEGGTPPFVYSVGGAPYEATTNYSNLVAGNYDIVVEDATGCLLLTTVTVPDGNDLFLDLGEDQYLKEGELADIYPESGVDSTNLVRIDWTTVANLPCPGCYYQLDLALDNSTQFFLEIQDENGCIAQDNVTIFIDKERNVYVPTAFSPDGEGDNNIFYIFSDESVEKVNSFLVFNRWGESVFEVYNSPTNDPTYGWDGLHRGQPVNAAVYVWFAEIEFKNGDVVVFSGDVVIMR